MSSTQKNKVALVTGSSTGIGLDIARCLAKRGVNVILTGSRDKSLLADVLSEFSGYGVRCDYVACDLSKTSNIDSLWSEVLRLYDDGIDILINNAGVLHLSEVESLSDEKYDLMMAVNLTAPFQLTKRCIPGMKKKGWGRIVNVSSVAGLISPSEYSVYSASKHGLIGLTKGVALETAQCGITCNAICPALVDTQMVDYTVDHLATKGISASEFMERIPLLQPVGKIIKTDQVAELIEFVCLSSASSQMTGAAYLIDGGWTAQ